MASPTHFLPAHRAFISALVAAFFALLGWASFARLDIVVVATGKLNPAGFVQVSQPPEEGVLLRVLVKDGDSVSRGQPLLELDPGYAAADVNTVEQQRAKLELQLQRVQAELEGKPFLPSLSSPLSQAAVLEYTLRRQALAAALTEADASQVRAGADENTAKERLRQAEQLLPLVARQAEQQAQLREQGFVSEAAVADKEKEFVAARQELAAQRSSVLAAGAARGQAAASRTRILGEYRKQLAAEQTQAEAELAGLESDIEKRQHRLSQLVLKAPVDGVVNGLSDLAPGQVVRAGQTLLSIVPKGEPLLFEGWLRNEDAAYGAPGMPVKVKVSPYPFQKYGWVEGEITWIGVDAETPESLRNAQGEPLFYRVRVKLARQALTRDGQDYALKPGMQAVADVQVGDRTLVEYLTSPVKKTLLEAAREK